MSFPDHIARVLDAHHIAPETKDALFDLYVAMGGEVLEVFAEIAEDRDASQIGPAATAVIRNGVVERYLRRNHPRWLEGKPTASLWHPRELEGRASGAVVPLGDLTEAAKRAIGPNQSLPDGVVLLGRNAHYGGRQDTVSFDVVPRDLEEARAIALASGQQHTVPGSVGQTSGTLDATHRIALVWEVQPNVYKPAGERNREIRSVWRRHRNWHLATLATAMEWLLARDTSIYVLTGAALAIAHEENPERRLSELISSNHDRTVRHVCEALDLQLLEVDHESEFLLLESSVMNYALRKHVLANGAAGLMWRVARRAAPDA